MSQDQSLTTEDLAARNAANQPASPAEHVAPIADAPSASRGMDDAPAPAGAADQADAHADGTEHGDGDIQRQAEMAEAGQRRPDDDDVSLVDPAEAEGYRARWADVQVRFVDDPREAVGAADALVAEAMQSLASAFADHKSRLETQWQGGGDVDTEELRVALRRYRSFFHHLLET